LSSLLKIKVYPYNFFIFIIFTSNYIVDPSFLQMYTSTNVLFVCNVNTDGSPSVRCWKQL